MAFFLDWSALSAPGLFAIATGLAGCGVESTGPVGVTDGVSETWNEAPAVAEQPMSSSSGAAPGGPAPVGGAANSDAPACEHSADCRAYQMRCCQDCKSDEPFVAVHKEAYETFYSANCGAPKCGVPEFVPGEPEWGVPANSRTAVCNQGTCELLQLDQSSFAACTTNSDCSLRLGPDCCTTGSYLAPTINDKRYYGGGLVALSDEAGYFEEHCAGVVCPAVDSPPLPNEVSAVCEQGACTVEYTGQPLTFGLTEPAHPLFGQCTELSANVHGERICEEGFAHRVESLGCATARPRATTPCTQDTDCASETPIAAIFAR